MNEDDLRDCFAMFAMNGLISRGRDEMLLGDALCKAAYEYADSMLEARKKEPDDGEGIVAIKKRKYVRKI